MKSKRLCSGDKIGSRHILLNDILIDYCYKLKNRFSFKNVFLRINKKHAFTLKVELPRSKENYFICFNHFQSAFSCQKLSQTWVWVCYECVMCVLWVCYECPLLTYKSYSLLKFRMFENSFIQKRKVGKGDLMF